VPSGWLTYFVLDTWGIIGYNHPVRSDKALRACRVRYARKSSFGFARSSCLWFLPPSAVEKSRSGNTRAGRQMGRWADRCRGIGHPLPTASDGPQAGRWRSVPQRLGSSTCRLQNRGNKARMYMKTKDEVKKSSNEAQSLGWTHPSPGSLRSPPSPQGRGLLTRFGRVPEAMRENAKIEGTKRECL
jgi:hypothetical protein